MIYAKRSFCRSYGSCWDARCQKLRAQPSPVDCDRYAQDYARTHSRNGQVLRGAGGGALLGAGIGALAGGAGAAIGAGVGAFTGGIRRTSHGSRIYNHAFPNCAMSVRKSSTLTSGATSNTFLILSPRTPHRMPIKSNAFG